EQAVKASTSRAQPRQHEAVDDAVRHHARSGVRSWCLIGPEEFPLDDVNLLPLGDATAVSTTGSPARLCGLQVGSPVGRMHPRLRDKIIRHGLSVEIVPSPRPSKLLRKSACALAT